MKQSDETIRPFPDLLRGLLIPAGLTLILLTPLSLHAESPRKPEHLIKWATIAPENTLWGDVINQASAEIEHASGGRVKHIWYYGAVMGDEPDALRKLKLGQLQGLALMSVGLSKIAPEMLAFSLPFLFESYEEVDCVFDQTWPTVEEIFNQKGYQIFGPADVGFSVLFSKHPIRSPADFARTKAWTWSGLEVDKAAAKIYGITHLVPLPLPEVLPALQTGMVDMVYATYYTAIALQWHTQVRYMTDATRHGGAYAPAVLVLKKDVYDSLPPDVKITMRRVLKKMFVSLREKFRADEERARRALLARGMRMLEFKPEVLYDIKTKRSLIIYRDWKGKYFPDWFLDNILDAQKSCRSRLAR